MDNTKLELTPLRSALLGGHDNDVHILVRARAQENEAPDARRQPLNLAIVIDRSGSMAGSPLREALRCARSIVDSMHEDDYASLVVYDDQVDTLVPNRRVGRRRRFHKALRRVVSGGCTALFDGWFAGAGEAAKSASGNVVSRVLLLSDGCANRGPSSEAEIAPRCAEMAEAGVSTSTYGLGGNFNEALMGKMAQAGLGNCYYGKTADDLMDPFRQEFDLLSALRGRKLRLRVTAPDGVEVDVLNGYASDSHDRFMLPDLAFGADVWALLRLRVPARLLEQCYDDVSVLDVSLAYRDMVSGGTTRLRGDLALPVLDAGAFAAVAEDDIVKSRMQELHSASLQEQIRDAALSHDWHTVDGLLEVASRDALDNPWLAEGLEDLKAYARLRDVQSTSKEAYYKSRRLRTRMTAPTESAAGYSAESEMNVPSFLRRKRQEGTSEDSKRTDDGTGD